MKQKCYIRHDVVFNELDLNGNSTAYRPVLETTENVGCKVKIYLEGQEEGEQDGTIQEEVQTSLRWSE